jgi:hypothetical protein
MSDEVNILANEEIDMQLPWCQNSPSYSEVKQ